jgi:hypothetical protein
MSIQTIEAKLKKLDRERERLSKQLETRKQKQYKAIPAKYGFKTIDALIAALTPYASSNLKIQLPRTATPAVAKRTQKHSAKRIAAAGRKKYTDHQKVAVKAALQKGGRTVAQISKDTDVAEYTIIDWKKQWGLVKKRRKAAKKK